MFQIIIDLKNSKWNNNEKKRFLDGILAEIKVTTKDKHTNLLDFSIAIY